MIRPSHLCVNIHLHHLTLMSTPKLFHLLFLCVIQFTDELYPIHLATKASHQAIVELLVQYDSSCINAETRVSGVKYSAVNNVHRYTILCSKCNRHMRIHHAILETWNKFSSYTI